MAKRSDGQFERRPRDLYDTPEGAVAPLLPHLNPETHFVEPCAGNGWLIASLEEAGHVCVQAGDIEPRIDGHKQYDAKIHLWAHMHCVQFITNPPWDRDILHPLIMNLSDQAPTWLLFDGDWIHTAQAKPFMPRLRRVVSVGRVKWIADSPHTGKDNAAWHHFGQPMPFNQPQFFGRA